MNSFYSDSHIIFKDLSKKITDKAIVSDIDIIQNSLFLAIGIEKLLKGILFDINPIFILENDSFKNAFCIYYRDKLISDSENTKDVNQEPNTDVIAFQNSVLRATLVSKTAFNYKNTLMRIKNYRDIIVHNSLDKLDLEEIKLFINRDFYLLLKAFSDELGWSEIYCFNNLHSKLALIASKLLEDIDQRIKLKIEAAVAVWKVNKKQNLRKTKKLVVDILEEKYVYTTDCPNCNNHAIVFTKPILDFNPYLKEEIQVGLQVIELFCYFCKLKVIDYKELDFLKITPKIEEKNDVISEYMEVI